MSLLVPTVQFWQLWFAAPLGVPLVLVLVQTGLAVTG